MPKRRIVRQIVGHKNLTHTKIYALTCRKLHRRIYIEQTQDRKRAAELEASAIITALQPDGWMQFKNRSESGKCYLE